MTKTEDTILFPKIGFELPRYIECYFCGKQAEYKVGDFHYGQGISHQRYLCECGKLTESMEMVCFPMFKEEVA